MSKQFVKGNVYVFTKKKYLEDRRKFYPNQYAKGPISSWVNLINGNEVLVSGKRDANVGRMEMWVIPQWCKCIKTSNTKIESEAI